MCQARYLQNIYKILKTARSKFFFTLISRTYITSNQCLMQTYSLRHLLDVFYMPDRTNSVTEVYLTKYFEKT